MGLLAILSIVVQASLIIHCIKTGRNTIWIWVLALLSFAGVIAYVAVEIVPELFGSRTAQRAKKGFKNVLDPHATLRRYENEARVTGGIASKQRFADELLRQGRYDEAIAGYRQILTGLYEHDPNLMLGLARAEFAKGDAAAARATLDDLIRLNPEFKSPEGHLLYARALQGEGNVEKALEEYKVIAPYYPGAEAATRYAQLLNANGHEEEAQRVVQELLDAARIAPSHYRKAQKTWLDQAAQLSKR